MNKYFNYCDSVFMGKSYLKKFELNGGQNQSKQLNLVVKFITVHISTILMKFINCSIHTK